MAQHEHPIVRGQELARREVAELLVFGHEPEEVADGLDAVPRAPVIAARTGETLYELEEIAK